MADTPRLTLPYISSSQSQKEVTHNESLNILDALLQATALNYTATPPGSPAAGDLYLVGASPTGAWSGHAQAVALYIGGTWEFHTPEEGWLCYDQTANVPRVFDGSTWVNLVSLGGGEANTASNVGTAGVGVFKQKIGVNLEFKRLNAGSSKVSITDDIGNSEVDVDVVEANLSLANLGTRAFLNLSDVPASYSGQGGKDVRVNSSATALEFYASPYDVGGTFAGTPTANLVILRYSMTLSQGVCVTGPSAQTDFDIQKNGTSFGTMRFAASGTVASFISASGATFAAGDILTVVAPATLNSLADLGFSLAGTR
jgi:hypothetical protein